MAYSLWLLLGICGSFLYTAWFAIINLCQTNYAFIVDTTLNSHIASLCYVLNVVRANHKY